MPRLRSSENLTASTILKPFAGIEPGLDKGTAKIDTAVDNLRTPDSTKSLTATTSSKRAQRRAVIGENVGSNNLPRGQVRNVLDGSLEHYLDIAAVIIDDIREALIKDHNDKGHYDHPRAKGIDDKNVTCFHASQKSRGKDRANWPLSLLSIYTYPSNGELWYHNERLVLDPDDRPIRVLDIPAVCSSQMEDWLLAAIYRSDYRVEIADLRARMPRRIKLIKRGAEVIEPLYIPNTLSMRMTRFRTKHGLMPREKRDGSDRKEEKLKSLLGQERVKSNSIEGFQTLTRDPVGEIEAVNKGRFAYRARKDKESTKRKGTDASTAPKKSVKATKPTPSSAQDVEPKLGPNRETFSAIGQLGDEPEIQGFPRQYQTRYSTEAQGHHLLSILDDFSGVYYPAVQAEARNPEQSFGVYQPFNGHGNLHDHGHQKCYGQYVPPNIYGSPNVYGAQARYEPFNGHNAQKCFGPYVPPIGYDDAASHSHTIKYTSPTGYGQTAGFGQTAGLNPLDVFDNFPEVQPSAYQDEVRNAQESLGMFQPAVSEQPGLWDKFALLVPNETLRLNHNELTGLEKEIAALQPGANDWPEFSNIFNSEGFGSNGDFDVEACNRQSDNFFESFHADQAEGESSGPIKDFDWNVDFDLEAYDRELDCLLGKIGASKNNGRDRSLIEDFNTKASEADFPTNNAFGPYNPLTEEFVAPEIFVNTPVGAEGEHNHLDFQTQRRVAVVEPLLEKYPQDDGKGTFGEKSIEEKALEYVDTLKKAAMVSIHSRSIPDHVPTSIESLILPTASHNFSRTLSSLKQSRLSIKNRLTSIYKDSQFVQHVSDSQKLPLAANERCGSWYIPTEKKMGSAYFKSTDGHQGQWKFSLRRLNLQILDVIEKFDGCIIVDSTRSGKSMPDALSKTVPIWCTVMNRLLFPDEADSHELRTPPLVVGKSEHSQIEVRLDSFLENLKSLRLDVGGLRAKLQKPLRVEWVTQASPSRNLPLDPAYHSVICCTASRQEASSGTWTDGYIQGAGDDSEGWSAGLTPAAFWQNSSLLLSGSQEEGDILELLTKSNAQESMLPTASQHTAIYPGNSKWPLFIGRLEAVHTPSSTDLDGIITCDEHVIYTSPEATNSARKPPVLYLESHTSKLGSRTLRNQLPRLKPFMEKIALQTEHPRLLFTCSTGRDLSVGVALTVLCLYFDDDGMFVGAPSPEPVTKDYIRRRLSWIIASKHDANPARATLQSVNAFLIERPR
ncbi:hypothetical protein MMC17_003784 [Xylographa soralifera]|nr:hypothetical protein [Xylographa soralifera]